MDTPLVAAPGSPQQAPSLQHVRTPDLYRAARHYRRALAALGEGFEHLAEPVLTKLKAQLASALTIVEDELHRRGPALSPTLEPVAASYR